MARKKVSQSRKGEILDKSLLQLKHAIRNNGFDDLLAGVSGGAAAVGFPEPNTFPGTLSNSNAYTPLSLNRVTLSYAYMTHGLVQTMINQPVLDAFRGGINIESSELSDEECTEINRELNKNRQYDRDRGLSRNTSKVSWQAAADIEQSDIRIIRSTRNWARLFGGAGMIINTTQNFSQPFDMKRVSKDTPLEFIAADRWELIMNATNIWDERVERPFNYYGLPLHRSRVIKSMGVEPPSYIRVRLQGWGMSEMERAIRPINAFLKFENVVFELLDEAKLDIFKIAGFNSSLLDSTGSAMTAQRLSMANQLKSYLNSIAMDVEDEYDRKQMTFSGIAELWNECRLNLCSALKMPMTKLFGVSASGFGSGADAMENYNSVCANEREESEALVRCAVNLRCQQKFGYVPEYNLKWEPLRTLDGEQEQMVLTAKQNRIMQLKQEGMVDGVEASILLRREELLSIETKVAKGLVEAIPQAGAGGAMIGNEGQLTKDKGAEKREDKPRDDKKAAGGKMKKS